VTGVQTCALPISRRASASGTPASTPPRPPPAADSVASGCDGTHRPRGSCRANLPIPARSPASLAGCGTGPRSGAGWSPSNAPRLAGRHWTSVSASAKRSHANATLSKPSMIHRSRLSMPAWSFGYLSAEIFPPAAADRLFQFAADLSPVDLPPRSALP